MNDENLISLKGKGDPRSDAIRAKQKGSSSQRRKDAQTLSNICRMKPETIERRALELVANPEASALTIMQYLSKLIQKEGLSDALKIQLLSKMCQAHATIHGTKADIRNLNVNVDAGSADSMSKLWEEVKGKQVKKEDDKKV